jgi:MFS family permease
MRPDTLYVVRNAIKQNNIRNLYWEMAAWGVTNGIVATFLSVYALRLGASEQQIGLLAALPPLVYIFLFIPAGRFVQSRRDIKQSGLAGLYLARLQYLLIALLPFLPSAYRVPALLVIVMLASIPVCIGNVAFTNVIADVVPPQARPHVVSRRNLLLSLTSALAAALAGKMLDLLPMPQNYQLLFVLAFGFAMLSVYFLSRMAIPDATTVGDFSLHPRLFVQQVREIVQIAWATPAFLRFTLGSVALHSGLVFAWPLFSLWWVNGLKASEGVIGIVTTVNMVIAMGANLLWARVAERRGNRLVALIGFGALSMLPIMYCLSPSAEMVIIPEIVGGVCAPAMSLGLFNVWLEVMPVANRPAYIAFYMAAISIPMFLAPLIATGVAVPLLGVWGALFMASFVRIGAWILLFLLIRQRK